MYNKATKYLFAGRYDKALQFFKKEPLDFKEKFLNMGNCYRALGDTASAAVCYSKSNDPAMPSASNVYGEYSLALSNLGLLSYALGDDASAISYYHRALTLDPLHYDALWNMGNATLRQYFSSSVGNANDWKTGWQLYDYRFKRSGNPVKIDNVLPTWDGVSVGESIVVLTEQGLGDKIMFGRYLKHLREYFPRVVVQCHPSLDCFYSDFEVCRDALDSGADVSVPLCSLAGHFGMVNERYLDGKFTARSFPDTGVFCDLNIGVVWSGSTTHANDRNRSCPSKYFTNLASYGKLYSLNPAAGPARNVEACKSKSWTETASTILGLDIVVTVDTSIVHLCGTLGVPCVMVQPLMETDFRWGLGHSDTPWYESVVIVNNPNNWDTAFKTVNEILEIARTEKRLNLIKKYV